MTCLIRRFVVVTMLAFHVPAAAQEPTAAAAPSPDQPSPQVAQTLSGLGVAAPIALVGLAIVFQDPDLFTGGLLLLIPGPSAGYIYGGQPQRGLASAGVRAAALAASLTGTALCWDGCGTSRTVVAGAAVVGGVWWMFSSAFRDAQHVSSDIQRANAQAAARVAPTLDLTGRGLRLGLAVRF